jgi:hypothetical protein
MATAADQQRRAKGLWDTTCRNSGPIPDVLDPTNRDHFQFAADVASDFGDVLQNEASPWHACMYQPITELPYPRDLTRKCLQCLAASPFTPRNFIESVRSSSVVLENFVDAGPELPTDPNENTIFVHQNPALLDSQKLALRIGK